MLRKKIGISSDKGKGEISFVKVGFVISYVANMFVTGCSFE